VPSKIATMGVQRVHAETYFRKARELCQGALAEFNAERYDATLILAIHAGISAGDAVCIGLGTPEEQGIARPRGRPPRGDRLARD
jgi:hypothetical protein